MAWPPVRRCQGPPCAASARAHRPTAPRRSVRLLPHPGAVFLHRVPVMLGTLGLDAGFLSSRPTHVAVALAFLVLPGAAIAGIDFAARAAMQMMAGGREALGTADCYLQASVAAEPTLLRLAYGYLPLVWAATLAYYMDMALTEGGRILPVRAICKCRPFHAAIGRRWGCHTARGPAGPRCGCDGCRLAIGVAVELPSSRTRLPLHAGRGGDVWHGW